MKRGAATLVLAALATAVPAMAMPHDPDAELGKLLAGRIAGQPVDCLSLRQATSSQVVAHRAIVYRVGSKLYVNRLRSGAEDLRWDDALITETIGGDLCSIDSVQLVDRGTRVPHGFVILDRWVPYSRPRAG